MTLNDGKDCGTTLSGLKSAGRGNFWHGGIFGENSRSMLSIFPRSRCVLAVFTNYDDINDKGDWTGQTDIEKINEAIFKAFPDIKK